MQNENPDNPPYDLRLRTKQFALRVIRLCTALPNQPEAWVLRKQLCRSGTSVGAQYREVCRARSKAEFVSKFESALQELDESIYWLELIGESGFHSADRSTPLIKEADELTSIFVSSIRTAKGDE
jgi:four helix bundle protein